MGNGIEQKARSKVARTNARVAVGCRMSTKFGSVVASDPDVLSGLEMIVTRAYAIANIEAFAMPTTTVD